MPNLKVFDMTGKETGTVELSDAVFGIETPNETVMHEAVKAYLANRRQGTQSTLTRAEVSGGGKKPWRQKGSGRARQGSTRAPQWTHGGIALGPKPRSYAVSMNKKARKLAICEGRGGRVRRYRRHRPSRDQDEVDEELHRSLRGEEALGHHPRGQEQRRPFGQKSSRSQNDHFFRHLGIRHPQRG